MTGERSAFRDVDFPDNFEDWPADARVQFLRQSVKKRAIQDYIADAVDFDDREIKQAFTKDQLSELGLWVAKREGDL